MSSMAEPKPFPEPLHGGLSPSASPASSDDMLGRIVRGAHDTVDQVAAKAAPMVEQLKGGVSQASDAAHQHADQLSQLGEEWTASLRSSVREHPLAALAVALAAGIIISHVTSR